MNFHRPTISASSQESMEYRPDFPYDIAFASLAVLVIAILIIKECLKLLKDPTKHD